METVDAYCPDCKKNAQAPLQLRPEAYTVRGAGPFAIIATIPICPICGADLYVEEIESKNQKLLFERYERWLERQKNGQRNT